jgi:acyl-CoA reductase-like NAD-dependent aldehyde dehydrogenase
MQAIVVEIQKKYITLIAEDAQFEEYMRSQIRENFPYMTSKERIEAMRAFSAIGEDRWKRLETQMAGFDFFTNVEQAIQTLSEAKVAKDIKEQVKALPAKNRARLVRLLDSIVEENKDDLVTVTRVDE